MGKYTKQQLEERYTRLPPILQETLFSPEVAEKLFEIGKKNGITIEKIGFAAEETGFVILGLTRPREFVSELASRLEVDDDTARKIALDISHQIFFPLREALKQTHQIEIGEEAIQTSLEVRPLTGRGPTPARSAAPPPPAVEKVSSIKYQGQRIPLVEIGSLKAPPPPAGGQPSFLTRDEVEKIVAEKKVTPRSTDTELRDTVNMPPLSRNTEPVPRFTPPPPKPPPSPAPPLKPQPSTPTPHPIPPVSTTPPQITQQQGQVSSIEYQGGSSPKVPPIDLRQPATSIKYRVSSIKEETQPAQIPDKAESQQAPAAPEAKIPSIDLRQTSKPQKEKLKPWSGYDPYREPVG